MSDNAVIVLLLGLTLFGWWLGVLQRRAADRSARITACEHKHGRVGSFDGWLTWMCSDCPFQIPLTQIRYYRRGLFFVRGARDPYRPVAEAAKAIEPYHNES